MMILYYDTQESHVRCWGIPLVRSRAFKGQQYSRSQLASPISHDKCFYLRPAPLVLWSENQGALHTMGPHPEILD